MAERRTKGQTAIYKTLHNKTKDRVTRTPQMSVKYKNPNILQSS
jgi:hypothetical protein